MSDYIDEFYRKHRESASILKRLINSIDSVFKIKEWTVTYSDGDRYLDSLKQNRYSSEKEDNYVALS